VLKDWLNNSKRVQDSPLRPYLRTFATSLTDEGYTDLTVKSKLWFLADFGQWLRKSNLSLRNLNEQRVEPFFSKNKRRVGRGDSRTLQQFLDHLRKGAIIPDRKPIPDKSPFADILSRYQLRGCRA